MSQVPYIMKDARFGLKMMHHVLTDALWEGLFDPNVKQMMGRTAENIAQKWGITREEQDVYAIHSHQKALKAQEEHRFDGQILPIKTQRRIRISKTDGSTDKINVKQQVIVSQDESPNRDLVKSPALTSVVPAIFLSESILNPVKTNTFIDKDGTYVVENVFWDEGTVTAVNSCPMNDGAAALLLMTEEKAVSLGMTPLVAVVSYAYAGCDPKLMGEGPIYAVPKALSRTGLKISDIDIFELNEAFAAQSIVCRRGLEIPDEKLNIFGGAIALGHAVGATGSKLVVQAMHALRDLQKRYAVITMCVGGGQGGCLIIERV